jgi:hypothetical protein
VKSANFISMSVLLGVAALFFYAFLLTGIIWIATGVMRGTAFACLVLYAIIAAALKQSFQDESTGDAAEIEKLKENGLAMDLVA